MIPCLPPGRGEEDRDKDPYDQEEDCGSGEESPRHRDPPSHSPQPESFAGPQLHRDQIRPPDVMLDRGQQNQGDQTPVLTRNFKKGRRRRQRQRQRAAPWESDYEKGAVTEMAGNSGSGNSLSFRTIWHPSFCELFDARASDTQSLALPEVKRNRESSQNDKGFQALCSEDFFFSDPLLPSITRIPVGLSQPPQQILRKSRQLLTPPPIMSFWIQPNPAPILTWQYGPEITAVTCLLEMNRGETKSTTTTPNSSLSPPTQPT
ncbi:histone deacetylase complex subunit SAP25 [Antechinus flavipes]|uniref:histone deacetylase complex subunit SAP25 n=1 Tax=Antechinus flavipes TaxID=38775 RepID=UPI0022367850|nr:histone deacetylase complex subunit SAP25 [Antechinus flavipes]